jgi:hypothetical protein
MLSEYAQRFFVQLVSVGNLGIKPYDYLRGKLELISKTFIKESVHRKLSELLLLPAKLRQSIGGGVGHFQGFTQYLRLFWRRQQFHLHSQLHAPNTFTLSMSSELRTNNHSVSRLLVQFVFVVKYRHGVIFRLCMVESKLWFRAGCKKA